MDNFISIVFRSIIFSLFIISSNTHAQNTVVRLSSSQFDPVKGNLVLSNLDGWVFNPADSVAFAAAKVSTTGWKVLNPGQLTTQHAHADGTVQGWFRIKISTDSTVSADALGIMNKSWTASTVYLDGRKLYDFGNPNANSGTGRDNAAFKKVPDALHLEPNKVYTLAIKVTDAHPITAEQLQTGGYDRNFRRVLMLTNQRYHQYYMKYWAETAFYDGLAISVTTVLTLLFLLIYLLNPREGNVRNFTIGSSFLAILSIGLWLNSRENTSYWSYIVFDFTNGVSAILFISFVPYLLAKVFNKSISRSIMLLLVIAVVIIFGGMFYKNQFVFIFGSAIPILLSAYYLLSNINQLNRAKWSIVMGFTLALIFLITYIFAATVSLHYQMIFVVIYTLAPPLGMMGYVAFRFREMIAEVRAKAQLVLQLSEEKRIHAQQQQKILEEKVEQRTKDLRDSLENLKSAQAQLVQSEKMASLGELTAGIAHEIQNPLNFVSNFAEVSKELLAEMKIELDDHNPDEALEIAKDVIDNLEKIVHHGKRADSIVKGMLQHSRSNAGLSELTDINRLAEEYLQLAYHGLRAKDKTFNTAIERHFDKSIPQTKIVPQDIGRVFLNLITNAFYAMSEKKKELNHTFSPVLGFRTVQEDNLIRIEITDNGNGIQEQLKDKIFQPFFTTKPTGSGTGLGLSLSYDIITAHGGSIKVNTQLGKGSAFLITIPIKK